MSQVELNKNPVVAEIHVVLHKDNKIETYVNGSTMDVLFSIGALSADVYRTLAKDGVSDHTIRKSLLAATMGGFDVAKQEFNSGSELIQ